MLCSMDLSARERQNVPPPFAMRKNLLVVGLWIFLASVGTTAERTDRADAAALDAMVEKDWVLQEERCGRKPSNPKAIRDALTRTEQLLGDLRHRPGTLDLAAETTALRQLHSEAADVASRDEATRLALYRRVRGHGRALALAASGITGQPIVFLKQRRFICQMLHEYLGYFYDYCDIAGGGVYVLEQPGRSLATRDLLAGRLPRGTYTTPAISYDGKTLYFAFCEVRETPRPHGAIRDYHQVPPADRVAAEFNYFSPGRRCFHLYSIGTNGEGLRQLTGGSDDDFSPCPLPDGGLAFLSSRRGGFGRCHNPYEPLPTYTLHRAEADGSRIRTLSYHETNEWHPAVLNDGRIIYSRWDYIDRSAAHYHGLWTCNPDGSNARALFGNATQEINACYQPQPIPGSDKLLFVAGAHHANVGGSLVMLDPARVKLDPQTGKDRLEAVERLTPEICFPEAEGWPNSYFHSPWPLSERAFLVAFSFEPLPGMSSKSLQDAKTGIYYFDRFGNLELLYRDPELACVGPAPLASRPTPPIRPSTLDPQMGEEGEFVLSNVNWSVLPLPPDRPVRKLRVFQILPKSPGYVANQPRLGYANVELARMVLGEVPVEPDGSAYFRAPARKLLYFQALDDSGRAVQTMRSAAYLQPGERQSCVGCHEPSGTAPTAGTARLALRRPPSAIQPSPDGTRPISFMQLVQPVLNRHCVRCHHDKTGQGNRPPLLTGQPAGMFTKSYESLRPFVRWYEWGNHTISETVTVPGRGSADESPLLKVLGDANHASQLKLPPQDIQQLTLWLDANASFYGTYRPEEQEAQRNGRSVPPPQIQ